MKAVLLSIHPQWCDKILDGKKTIEVRKTKPKLEPPFKCYIYMTSGGWAWRDPFATAVIPPSGKMYNGAQTVIGEFTCDKISIFRPKSITLEHEFKKRSCLTVQELIDYADTKNEHIYAWSISNLIVYDEPKPLSSFNKPCPYRLQDGSRMDVPCPCDKYTWGFDEKTGLSYCMRRMEKPPQSWCYVEVLDNGK